MKPFKFVANQQTSKYLAKYNAFFAEVEDSVEAFFKTLSNLRSNDVTINLNKKSTQFRSITPLKIERCGAVVTYRVTLGTASILIKMLNLPINSSTYQRIIVGCGAFGSIIDVDGEFVAKRIYFR